jgi:phage gpG-like protein
MPTVRNAQGLRIDNLVDLGFTFKPSLAMSAKAFNKMDLDIRSYRVPLKRAIQRVLAPSIGQNFIANGRPDVWVPYSDQTVQMKMNDPKNRFGEGDMLRRSGLLWKTMQQYNIWTVTQNQAAILNLPDKVWYGAVHQAGYGMRASSVTQGSGGGGLFMSPKEIRAAGGSAKVFIPARPFALFQSEDIDKVQEIFADWVLERASANLAIRTLAKVR